MSDDNPKKRNLITKGELPVSAGGGKSTLKEKIGFAAVMIIILVVIIVYLVFI